MDNNFNTKDMWNKASAAAPTLALVPILYSLSVLLLDKINAGNTGSYFLLSLFKGLLWLGKFSGCIILMKFLMGRFASSFRGVTRKDAYRYGLMLAFLSALVCAAYYLVDILFIQPDLYAEVFDSVLQTNGSMLDSNTRDALERVQDKLPAIGFFCNLIYCFLFGMVLSAIFAGKVVSDDFFDDTDIQNPDEQ